MNTNPSAWNVEAYLGNAPITLPQPRELYEMALVRMKAGEVIDIGGRRYKAISKDATSAASISNRLYRVNFVSAAISSTETASSKPDIPKSKFNTKNDNDEPIAIIKVNNELTKFYWLNTQDIATAYLAVGDILRYTSPAGTYKIVAIEYDMFEDDYFWVTQFCEVLG